MRPSSRRSRPSSDARRLVADKQSIVNQANSNMTDLRSDEERQRANVTALASADKPSRERFVHDLNATEDQIAAAQTNLTAAQTQPAGREGCARQQDRILAG